MSYPYGSMQTAQTRVEVVNAFMRGVYGWMCLGLLVTAGASVFTIGMPPCARSFSATRSYFLV